MTLGWTTTDVWVVRIAHVAFWLTAIGFWAALCAWIIPFAAAGP